MLHRASMEAYQKKLESRGIAFIMSISKMIFFKPSQEKIEEIWVSDPVDKWLESKLKREASKSGMAMHRLPSPGFLTPEDWLFSFFKDSKHLSMTHFYVTQRKRLNVLVKGTNRLEENGVSIRKTEREFLRDSLSLRDLSPPLVRMSKKRKPLLRRTFPNIQGRQRTLFILSRTGTPRNGSMIF